MPEKYTATRFIEEILVRDMKGLCEDGYPFYAFVVLCQGVEVIGNLFDQQPFGQKGMSEDRFDRGLSEVYSQRRYDKAAKEFFEHLRGSLIHQLRPGQMFCLAAKARGATSDMHLSQNASGQTVLVIEDLIEDFERRFGLIIKNEGKYRERLNQVKLTEVYIEWDEPPMAPTSEGWTSLSTEVPSLTTSPVEKRYFTNKGPEPT